MCGSGLWLIEAAYIALNRAPGLMRNNYGFMFIKNSLKNSAGMRKKAKANARKNITGKIIATDIDKMAIIPPNKTRKQPELIT